MNWLTVTQHAVKGVCCLLYWLSQLPPKLYEKCTILQQNLLFLWIASINGLSLGWRCTKMGVPIKSWGKYPNSGTALKKERETLNNHKAKYMYIKLFKVHLHYLEIRTE